MKYNFEQRVKTSKGEGTIIGVPMDENSKTYTIELDRPQYDVEKTDDVLDTMRRYHKTKIYETNEEELDQYNQ